MIPIGQHASLSLLSIPLQLGAVSITLHNKRKKRPKLQTLILPARSQTRTNLKNLHPVLAIFCFPLHMTKIDKPFPAPQGPTEYKGGTCSNHIQINFKDYQNVMQILHTGNTRPNGRNFLSYKHNPVSRQLKQNFRTDTLQVHPPGHRVDASVLGPPPIVPS